jgi:hypothetical protein
MEVPLKPRNTGRREHTQLCMPMMVFKSEQWYPAHSIVIGEVKEAP